MTIIAGATEGEGRAVYLAADQYSIAEESMFRVGHPKVRTYGLDDGTWIGIGGAGDTAATKLCINRALESLEYKGPPDPRDPDIVADWLQEFAEQWTAEVNALDPRPIIDAGDGASKIDASALVAYNGRLYYLEQHQCEEIRDGYGACGAGTHFALGSLHTSAVAHAPVGPAVQLAVATAIRFDKFCGGGIDMVRVPGADESAGATEAEREVPGDIE